MPARLLRIVRRGNLVREAARRSACSRDARSPRGARRHGCRGAPGPCAARSRWSASRSSVPHDVRPTRAVGSRGEPREPDAREPLPSGAPPNVSLACPVWHERPDGVREGEVTRWSHLERRCDSCPDGPPADAPSTSTRSGTRAGGAHAGAPNPTHGTRRPRDSTARGSLRRDRTLGGAWSAP
jgi:hypothetical protein